MLAVIMHQSVELKKPKKKKKNLLECREEEKKENIQADMLSPIAQQMPCMHKGLLSNTTQWEA